VSSPRYFSQPFRLWISTSHRGTRQVWQLSKLLGGEHTSKIAVGPVGRRSGSGLLYTYRREVGLPYRYQRRYYSRDLFSAKVLQLECGILPDSQLHSLRGCLLTSMSGLSSTKSR